MSKVCAGGGMIFAGCLALAYIVAMPVFYGLFSFKHGWDDWDCYAP